MKEDHQLQFICKFCTKRFPCGKSLGGHIRSHLTSKSNSSESDEREVGFGVEAALKDAKPNEFSNGQSSYVLRENPTRTWKTADSNSKSNSRICKQCGKSFQSQKALCGHMACHSEKEKNPKADDDDYDEEEEDEDDDSWASERGGEKRVFFDTHSDTESEDLAIRAASIRPSCKKAKKIDGPNYSSVTEIDDDDDERADLAKSLMKLSRDRSGYADVINSVEAKKRESARIESGRPIRKDEDFEAKLDSDGDTESCDTAGYYLEEYGNNREAEVSSMYNSAAVAAYFAGFEAKKKRPLTTNNQETCDDSPTKRSKYECFNCKKVFKSYQALGGHRPCHKRMGSNNGPSEPRLEAGEDVPEDSKEAANANANGNKVASGGGNRSGLVIERKDKGKKSGVGNKGHVCPFCDRVFKNGQALGGHKRSHFLGGNNNEGSSSGSHVREAGKPRLLDLNLPAPKEEGGDADDDEDGDEDGGNDEEEEQEEEEDVEEEGDDQSLTWR